MTTNRKISVNIAIETLAKHKVLDISAFMTTHRDELLETMKEAEATEHWTLIKDKVEELLNV